MQIEYEATFANINKDEIRERLKVAGAQLIKPEFMQKRVNFNMPKGHEIDGGWLRVRNEGDKITLSLKVVNSNESMDGQKEICLKVDNFENAKMLLGKIGCQEKAYQESMREIWQLDETEICIDEWPFLEPFVEIEGSSENEVMSVCNKLGFDYSNALFCAVDLLYLKKYGAPKEFTNTLEKIIFTGENPFLTYAQNEN